MTSAFTTNLCVVVRLPTWVESERLRPLGHLVRPLPLVDLGVIDAMLVSVVLALDLQIAELLFCVSADPLQLRHAVDHVDGQAEAIDLVLDGQIERRVDVSFFLVAAHVQVLVIGPPIGQAVDQPRDSRGS